jgi:hypothetical protein
MKPLIVTALLALAAPQADAGDVKVDLGLGIHAKGLHIDFDLFGRRPRIEHRRTPRHVCYREWVPGYYETVRRRVWVPGHFEVIHTGRQDRSHRREADRGRHRHAVKIRYHHRHRGPRKIWVPGHYRMRTERVWHPGHWRHHCRIPGHRHH